MNFMYMYFIFKFHKDIVPLSASTINFYKLKKT